MDKEAPAAGKQFRTTITVVLELDKLLSETCTIEAEAVLKPGSYTLNLALENTLDGGKIHRKTTVVVAN